MTAPRKPQDRQAKAETAAPPVLEEAVDLQVITMDLPDGQDDEGNPKTRSVPGRRVTLRGLTVEIPDESLDDFELLDDLRAAQDDEDGSRLPSLLRRLLGADYKRVLDALRDPVTGRVTVEAGATFVWDLFKALNPNS
jgi:hypothetical protein